MSLARRMISISQLHQIAILSNNLITNYWLLWNNH